ncbi:MAG: hypothetical protein GX084_05420 [Acholeplasmataceae bacterium]|nr:hypothetical protein [Acholeplasmataceae bacterium]
MLKLNRKSRTWLSVMAITCSLLLCDEVQAADKVFSEDDIQRGEVLSVAYGDVDGDGEEEGVFLMGSKFSADSQYYTKLYLFTRDMKSGKLEGAIRPTLPGGYDCSLRLGDLTGNGVDDIVISAPTGGSGGIVAYRIIDFTDNKPREIFTEADNSGVNVKGQYLPDYKVMLVLADESREITLDVGPNLAFYKYLGVYDEKGRLLKDYHRPYGQYLSGLLIVDTDGNGTAEAVTTQRIVGLNNTDTLGYVRAVWHYTAVNWQLNNYAFHSPAYWQGQGAAAETFIGIGGYKVIPEKAVLGRTEIVYPHVVNLGRGPQQWKLNSEIEGFVRKELEKIAGKGYLELNYEVKYGGYDFLSLIMNGRGEGREVPAAITKVFNFDTSTGEAISLEDLLGGEKKLWEKLGQIGQPKEIKPAQDKFEGYYFDGEFLVLLQKNDGKNRLEEIFVPKKELFETFRNNRIEKN